MNTKQRTIICSNCNQPGHNKRTCKNIEKYVTQCQAFLRRKIHRDKFDLNQYLCKIDKMMTDIFNARKDDTVTYDILDTKRSEKSKKICKMERLRQMDIGRIWQKVIGNYKGYEDLGIGHVSGLDVVSHSNKIIIELKNRTNTDNASAKKSNLNKLAEYKLKNPDYTCIYGTINDNTLEKTKKGSIKKIRHKDVDILHYTGRPLLELVFQDNTDKIIKHMKFVIDNHSNY
jgi:hypothetical protein